MPPLRTNEDFRSRRQEEHHNGETILSELEDYDLVDEVVLDWMHVTLLGAVRKLLHLFKGGKLGVRFQYNLIIVISAMPESMQNFIPI